MLNDTQKQFVIDELNTKGFVSRNHCLRNYISRLGAIIWTLKQEGWDIEGRFIETNYGKDFQYFWLGFGIRSMSSELEQPQRLVDRMKKDIDENAKASLIPIMKIINESDYQNKLL